jgi:hypothetical protein
MLIRDCGDCCRCCVQVEASFCRRVHQVVPQVSATQVPLRPFLPTPPRLCIVCCSPDASLPPPSTLHAQASAHLRQWFEQYLRGDSSMWADDRNVLAWMAQSGEYLNSCMMRLRTEMIAEQVLPTC